ncbi:MAG: MurR/RpiR family transcriptional regulator [Deinococcales bacterium]
MSREISSDSSQEQALRIVLARVRGLISSFTPSEQAVAQLVLDSPQEVIYLSVDALAKRADVSTTSVIRFCQSLGFIGFKDFKISLTSELGRPVAVLSTEVRDSDSPFEIAKKVFQADMQAIADTLELLMSGL